MGKPRQRQEKERLDAEALLEKADQAASDGNYELAETLETQAAAVQQIAAPISVPAVIAPMKARGAATTKKWRCVITDASLIPREWLMPNEKALGVYASSMKDNAKIPGCEFLSEDVLSIR